MLTKRLFNDGLLAGRQAGTGRQADKVQQNQQWHEVQKNIAGKESKETRMIWQRNRGWYIIHMSG